MAPTLSTLDDEFAEFAERGPGSVHSSSDLTASTRKRRERDNDEYSGDDLSNDPLHLDQSDPDSRSTTAPPDPASTRIQPNRNYIDSYQDSQVIREAKIYAALLVAQQRDEDQSVEKAPWQPSKEFKVQTNVRAWVLGIFLSPCLPAYKGDIAVNRMMSVTKRERSVFELPPSNNKDFAKWGTITNII
ncbi:uncharacterized protein PHACADRAFT_203269 [Phanerochaete carnosa HHB-10118-sp]|uniref:Uncharacterized protein n=1 Tax=Phanerochaete carnosa (strain HHB-10118-sp) TaxID=650164 RepID=K5VN07_PHACS|nr:uncharacterized protein PHACADRAFT_203269 [Phanerochaete carnosa HHB-10118-sp]EKM48085.1 hypothetical protein PHACADRAFT_203269 [Phanerochaete carnosa HHB-10118-sp]